MVRRYSMLIFFFCRGYSSAGQSPRIAALSAFSSNCLLYTSPGGCVWASREELRTTYTLPGAFAAYKDRMLG